MVIFMGELLVSGRVILLLFWGSLPGFLTKIQSDMPQRLAAPHRSFDSSGCEGGTDDVFLNLVRKFDMTAALKHTASSDAHNPIWLWTDGSAIPNKNFCDAGYAVLTDTFQDEESRNLHIQSGSFSDHYFRVLLCSKFPGRQTIARAE